MKTSIIGLGHNRRKQLSVHVDVHDALKARAAKEKRNLVVVLDDILRKALKV